MFSGKYFVTFIVNNRNRLLNAVLRSTDDSIYIVMRKGFFVYDKVAIEELTGNKIEK